MNKEELLKAIMELPKAETDNTISAMNSINVDDLMSAVDRLNKVPTYDELLKENKKQKEVIDKAIEYILECSINEKGHINVSLSSEEVGKLLDILEECYNE